MTGQVDLSMSERLVNALNRVGLDAHILHLEGGPPRVVVPLFDSATHPPVLHARDPEVGGLMDQTAESWSQNGYLYIATRGEDFPTEVGMLGVNGETGEQFESKAWEPVSTVDEAVNAFQNLWNSRDSMFSDLASLEP
ncbi:MAG: hypothetical protein GX495_04490 [Chloroflexi bacterium]|jgi:hypothetical protein|nr:hypothetical protein [Chloroflexota bacterium]